METLVDLLREAAQTYGHKPALSMRAGLRLDTWSYARLWRAAGAVARYLSAELALGPGDRLLVWAPNCPQLVAAYFGAIRARLILVPLDPYSTDAFIRRVAEKTQAAALLAGRAAPDVDGLHMIALADLPFEGEGADAVEAPAADDVVEVVFTSGTTGSPKGVVLTHTNIVANVKAASAMIPKGAHYRLLSLLPLSHVLEQTVGLYLPLFYGGTVYYPTSRQSSVIGTALQRYRIVAMLLVPQVLDLMLKGIERQARQRGRWQQWQAAHRLAAHLPLGMRRWLFKSVHRQLGGQLDFFVCGGAALAPELALAWERIGIKVVQGYGATECAPVVAANTLTERVPGSVGRAVTGVQVRLSDEGEVLVRGPNVFFTYWQDDAATQAVFLDDGWYRTGDLGELDARGNLFLKGRLRDLIVLPSGLNVYPEDVERELVGEEGIADCVALGLPDGQGNLRVHAVALPANGGPDHKLAQAQAEAAVRSANRRLAPHQQITGVSLWDADDFPRTNLLKVKRHEVLAGVMGAASAPEPTVAPTPTAAVDRFVRLHRILAQVSGVSAANIGQESSLSLDLRLDSLSRVELAVLLEEELGVAVDETELTKIETVGQLSELVDRGGQPASPLSFPSWALGAPARVIREVLQQALVFPLHAVFCHPFHVEGREYLQGLSLPVLFIANHSSHLDAPSALRALPSPIRRQLAVAAASDYFFRDPILGFGLSLLLNSFPFSREGAVRASLEYCGELVDAGWSVLIFPEGTRSLTGKLLPFRSGIGLLAMELRLPVVPMAIKGTHRVLPKGAGRPRPGSVSVRIGPPLKLSTDLDYVGAATVLESAVARLMPPRMHPRPGPENGD